MSSLDRILPFLKPIEDLLVDPAITEVLDRPAPVIPALREAPQLGARSELRTLRGGLDAVGASVRPFGNSAFDRRRSDDNAQSA